MRKLGDQWVEELDGKKHMLKAVEPFELCQGCLFNSNHGGCCWKCFDSCHMGNYFIIKDLGDVDGIGALRCPFCRQYPSLDYAEEQFRLLCKDENHLIDVGFHATLEQAIDAWNRRA